MTIARACRPPAQELCRRLAGRWWIAQHPPRLFVAHALVSFRSACCVRGCRGVCSVVWLLI